MSNSDNIFRLYSKDIIFILDDSGLIVDTNRSAENFFKANNDQLVGKDLVEHLKIINLPLFPNIQSLGNIENFPVMDLFYRHSIEKKLYLFTVNKYITNNKFFYYVFCGNEIGDTELKNISFSSIIDSLPGALYWKDKEGRYIGCNSVVLKMAGFTKKNEIIGKTDYELCWSEYADQWRSADIEVMETGNEIVKEEYAKLANGKTITELTHKAPLKNKQGEIIGIIGTSLDISEKKQLEAELLEAKRQAESSSKAKTEFIANMSHDIRTPITGMLGLAQSVYDATENSEVKEDVELLINTTHELLSFFNEIMDIVSFENGCQNENDEIFSIKNIIDHNLILLKSSAKHKGIELELNIESNLPRYVKGNQVYFDRIILNILSNAIKFTEKGEVSISVSQISKVKDIATVRVIIRDTGIGIPNDKLDTIFENFSRLTPSYQGIYKGSGLGLFTVKQYLESMGGVISVTSEEKKGSTFIVDVPLQVVSARLVDTSGSFSAARNSKSNNENLENLSANILVIEDNLLAARMAGQIIQKCQSSYSIASNGEEALRLVQKNNYDLILMDIGLPDINGFNLSKKIRKLQNKKLLPIIALTGHISPTKEQECVNAGMQEMLTKPISLIQAQRIIQKYCHTHLPLKKIEDIKEESKIVNFPTLDLDEGKRLAGNDLFYAKEMILELLKTLEDDIAKLFILEKNNDMAGLSKFVHKLYGGLCYCGVPRLRELMGQLNTSLSKGDYDSIEIKLENIAAEANNVIQQWKEIS